MCPAKVKAAFFDIDGTLLRGFLICSFSEYLSKKGFFYSQENENIQQALHLYSAGRLSASDAAREIPNRYALGIKGKKKEKISELAKKFVLGYKENIFSYAEELVNLMNRNGFTTIAISGSPIEVVEKLDFLGFKHIYGTEYSTRDGVYDGKIKNNLVVRETKTNLFSKIVLEKNIDLKESYAFGDTEWDLPMLSAVSYPVAVNPNKELMRVAEEKKWIYGDNKLIFKGIMRYFLSSKPQ